MWKREIAGKACMGVLIKACDWNLLSLHYSLLIDVHDLNFKLQKYQKQKEKHLHHE